MKEQHIVNILSDVLRVLCCVNTTVRIGKIWTKLYSKDGDLYRLTSEGQYWPNLDIKNKENYNIPFSTIGNTGYGSMFMNGSNAVNWDLGGGIYVQRDKFEMVYIIHTPNGQCKDTDLTKELRADFHIIMSAIIAKTPVNCFGMEWNRLKKRNNYTMGLQNKTLKMVAYEILNDNRIHRRRKHSKYKIAKNNLNSLGIKETPRLDALIAQMKSKNK
ncbi:MAG: hypothetical protein MJ187_00950 [Alphaproteobacteria bacterium]|nr:hypothetical protein [Alphaproteobacteria bacterium]